MSSKSRRKQKEDVISVASSSVSETSLPSEPVNIEYESRFVHGSPDSRDLDVVYIVPPTAQFPSVATLVAFCRNEDEDRNVIQLARENGNNGDWFVKKSFRGAPDEVNNAILETHRNLPNDPLYHLAITSKGSRSVLLRFIVATKAIIIKMRRTESCRPACVDALRSWLFSTNLSTVHGACRASFGDLDQESAKYVTFHFAQSYALALGSELYSKKSLIAFLPSIEPLLYYQGSADSKVPEKHVKIMRDLEDRWYGLTSRIVSRPFEADKYIHSFHLSGPFMAYNYLEADCVGTVIDIQTERIVALGVLVPFATPAPPSHPSASESESVIKHPPSWPFDNAIISGGESVSSEARWFTIGSHAGRLVTCEHAPTPASTRRNVAKSSSAKGKAASSKSVIHLPQGEGSITAGGPQLAELINRLCEPSLSPLLETLNFAVQVLGEMIEMVTARSTLSLRAHATPSELDLH